MTSDKEVFAHKTRGAHHLIPPAYHSPAATYIREPPFFTLSTKPLSQQICILYFKSPLTAGLMSRSRECQNPISGLSS